MNRALALLAPVAAVLLLAGCSPKKEKCFFPNIECGGKCVDASQDPANCGNCGVTCTGTQTCCGSCVDLTSNDLNCGACGARCPNGGSCSGSTCRCPDATPTTCGTNPGNCVDLQTDPDFCGTCGQACFSPLLASSTEATCTAGACTCSGGATDCVGETPQCRNTQTDPTACGGCGTVCPPHATCASGSCACGNPAFPDSCGLTPGATGCVNFKTDPSHCGSCTTACSGATPTCSNGVCCASGSTSCSGTCVNTRTDASNCGTCGHACPAGQSCSNGTCGCSGATPLACGTSCCAGSACCGTGGSTCQTTHDNGLGGHFFDCNPLFSPAQTNQQNATTAAQSWAVGTTLPGMCDGFCVAQQTATACGIWCFAGSPNAGHVTSGPTVNCPALCANFTGPTPTWQ